MPLKNTTMREDQFLADHAQYPDEVFKIAQRLDQKLEEMHDEIDTKDGEIEALQAKIETLENRIAELEADLEEAARGETQ